MLVPERSHLKDLIDIMSMTILVDQIYYFCHTNINLFTSHKPENRPIFMHSKDPTSHIKPNLWRLFLDLVEMGSLSKLSNAQDIAQPQLSRQLAELESWCGGALFKRNGRGMALTELGQWCYPRVKDLIRQSEQLEHDIRTSAGTPIGEVRIASMPSAVIPILLPVIQKAKSLYPEVKLIVQEALDSQMDERLKNGNFDLAIRYIHAQHLNDSDDILLMAGSYLVGPKTDRLTQSKTINFADLANLHLILPCRPSQWRNHLDDVALQKGFKLQVIEQADSLALQKAMVQNSSERGKTVYTILGPLAIQDELSKRSLQVSQITDPELTRAVAITSNPKQQSTQAKEMIKELIKVQARTIFKAHKLH